MVFLALLHACTAGSQDCTEVKKKIRLFRRKSAGIEVEITLASLAGFTLPWDEGLMLLP